MSRTEKIICIKLIFLGFGCAGKGCSKFISTCAITQRVLESEVGGNCKNQGKPGAADRPMNWRVVEGLHGTPGTLVIQNRRKSLSSDMSEM